MNAAVRCVRAARALPALLSLVLRCGNFLNEHTARANAKGFELEVLQKLGETKSTVSDEAPSQISLLHHLARKAVGAAPDAATALKAEHSMGMAMLCYAMLC